MKFAFLYRFLVYIFIVQKVKTAIGEGMGLSERPYHTSTIPLFEDGRGIS